MKIFISWSGLKSKAAAYLLRDWLPSVIQLLDTPWVSDVDIESGANWSASIGQNLTEAQFGIVCVTRENQDRPWLNFEAGAISKLVGGAVPLLIDFKSPGDLSAGPMSQLQVRMPDLDGITKLMNDINNRLDRSLDAAVLTLALDRGFAELEGKLGEINGNPRFKTSATPKRGSDEKIDEMLNLVRNIANEVRSQTWQREGQRAGATQPTRTGMTSASAMSGEGTLSLGGQAGNSTAAARNIQGSNLQTILKFHDLPPDALRIRDLNNSDLRIEIVSAVDSATLHMVRAKLKETLPAGMKITFYKDRSANPDSDILYIIDDDKD